MSPRSSSRPVPRQRPSGPARSTAAAAIRTAARIMDVIDPASALIKVGTAGARIAIPTIADLVKSVDLSKIDIGNLGPGAKIDIPDMPQVEAPKIEVPSVARGDMTLDTPSTSNTADVPVRTVDTAATVPVRRAGAGRLGRRDTDPCRRRRAHRRPRKHTGVALHLGGEAAPTGGGGDSILAGPMPPAVEAGPMVRPVGGPTVRPGVPTTDAARSGIRAKAIRCSPMLTMAQGSRAQTTSAATIDPDYGQPRADHGRLGDQYLPPRLEDLPPDVRKTGHRSAGAVRT